MTTIRGTNSPIATSCFPTSLPAQPAQPSAADERAQFRSAVGTLKASFGEMSGFGWFGLNDTIDMNELYKTAQTGSPAAKEAARFLLSHPDMLTELETRGKGGGADGKISMKDIDTQLSSLDREAQLGSLRSDPRLAEFAQSMGVLEANWGTLDTAGGGWFNRPDGKVSQEDLDKVITNPNADPNLRKAAFFLSMNRDLLALVDTAAKGGKADGVMSVEDLRAFSQQVQNVARQMPEQFNAPRTY